MKQLFSSLVLGMLLFAVAGSAEAALLTIDANGKAGDLTVVGSGIRTKTFLKVKVYEAKLLVSDPSKYVHDDDKALDSLTGMSAVGIQAHFTHEAPADKVLDSFKEGFAENKVNTETPAIQQYIAAITAGGDVHVGETMTTVIRKQADGKESLSYEDNKGKVTTIVGDAGLTHQILSIWLGKTTDGGLETLKKSLVHGEK